MRALLLVILLAGCSTTQPAVEVRTVEVVREVQRPCAAVAPVRPAPVGKLPANAVDAVLMLAAKLLTWSGPGGYADRAEDAIESCTAP